MNYFITALITVTPALFSSLVVIYQVRNESKKIRAQHEVNIEAIREQHKLDLIAKEKEYEYQKELMMKNHEYTLALKDKDLTNNFGEQVMSGALDMVIKSPHAKEMTSKAFSRSRTNKYGRTKRKQ